MLKETFFLTDVDVTKRNWYIAEAVIQSRFAKKASEIFGKTHRKTPLQDSFFSV